MNVYQEMQMNIFEIPKDPLWSEFRSLEWKQDNLRKGIFQRYGALLQMVESMQKEILELREEVKKYRKDQFDDLELFAVKK